METEIFARKTRTLAEIVESKLETDAAIIAADGEITPELEEYMAADDADLARKVDGYSAAVREQEARAKAIAEEIKRLQALKKTAENTAVRIKEFLKFNMERLGVERVNGMTSKAYFTTTSAVLFDDETILAPYAKAVDELRKTLPAWLKADITVSREELKKAIKALGDGEEIRGAAIMTGKALVLK